MKLVYAETELMSLQKTLQETTSALLLATVERALLMDLSTRVCSTKSWSMEHEQAVENLRQTLKTISADKPCHPKWAGLIGGVEKVLADHRFLERIKEIGRENEE